MRKLLAGLLALALGSVCFRLYAGRETAHQSTVPAQIPELTAGLTDVQLERERDLARWYNLSLRKNQPQDAAYGMLLDFGDGRMGYLEFPGQGVVLPIVHASKPVSGAAVHCRETAFPIGGRGNCPVLHCTEISVDPGEAFRIHILGTVLTYRVTYIVTELPGPENSDRCILQLVGEDTCFYAAALRTECP